jgi:ABC-2 type transport system ATP-binding protein
MTADISGRTMPSDQHSIELADIVKSFGGANVVDGVSFTVDPGEIFGLIGPNGAGKTTTIRMMMDIIKPDAGRITVLGEHINEAAKDRIGYLPEERGLYKKLTVRQSLLYIGTLKGMVPERAAHRADELLVRTGMQAHAAKKVEELSRGMSQIIQFLITIIHAPELIVLDEPFANLDPVNSELIKDIIFELRAAGTAIILSTHRMNEVEEMCDRVFMINKGKGVLYGELAKIKDSYRKNAVFLEYEGDLGDLAGVTVTPTGEGRAELALAEGAEPQHVLERLIERGVTVNLFRVSTPPLNDIFLQVVGEADA